jgi:glutamate dehydrogenase/leucine dehydrogenase
MNKVYTFTTGGSRDGIYLDSLSSSEQGVKDLIQNYFAESGLAYIIREVTIIEKDINVNCYDVDSGFTEYKSYRLVSFSVS